MPQVPCPSCGSLLKIGDNLAGARVRCPSCKNVFQAPAARARPRPVAAPAPPPSPSSPFDFGGPTPSGAPTQRNAFANLESDDPGVMLGRRSLRKAADAMGRAATMLMILPCVAGVLQMFVLAFNRVPLPGLAIFLAIYLVFSVFLLALPVTFMLLGASALRKTSSLGLAVTGAVFAVLVGGLLALGALGAAVSIVAGNLGGLVGAPVAGIGAYFCITTAILTFKASGDPEVREAFAQAREQREEARERRRA